MEGRHFQDWITFIAGVGLLVAAFTLPIPPSTGASSVAVAANFVICGAAAIFLSLAALYAFRQWEEWLDVLLGLWLIASPWALGFTGAQNAFWTALVAGAVIAVMGAWTTYEDYSEGHA